MKQTSNRNLADENVPLRDRWIDSAGEGSPETRAGVLFREALRREPLDAGRLAAIRERLRGDGRGIRPHRAWRAAIALGLILLGGGLTATASRYLHWPNSGGFVLPIKPTLLLPAPLNPRVHSGRGITPPPSPSDTLSLLDDPPLPQSLVIASRRRTPPPEALEGTDATPPKVTSSEYIASALAEESKLLTEAMQRLRQNDDARGALATLDEHDVRFGNGALAPEATLARIETLMKLRRNTDALSLLDRMAPSPTGIGRDLLIAHAELRAAAGQCALALADFDLLLRSDPAFDYITERALWGRASCRTLGANADGARVDLQDYLARFPSGRFARAARAALGE